MASKINVLLVGTAEWPEQFNIRDNVEITIFDAEEFEKKIYEVVILDRNVTVPEAKKIKSATRGYCLFITENVEPDETTTGLLESKIGKLLPTTEIQNFFDNEIDKYFGYTYGQKEEMNSVSVSSNFAGQVKYIGASSIEMLGDYGNQFTQILFWKYNTPIETGNVVDYWLEYEKDDSVEILLEVFFIATGSTNVIRTCSYTEEDLKNLIVLKNEDVRSYLFLSIKAKGNGRFNLKGLHSRHSRSGLGAFWVGGERVVTKRREEIFGYFEPGDLKPPLAVYFSGYKTQEGFEGYYMLRSMGVPFLLIAEQRLEGGAFYLGDDEYEKSMVDFIQEHLDRLGFNHDQLILSGISMGSTGSIYYGGDLSPHALILGKPLANLGSIAKNEKLSRPGGFPTSLDMLRMHSGDISYESIVALDERFWSKYEKSDWSKTKIIISYLYEDDYDNKAYEDIISRVSSAGVQVYGKGIHGRHNDNTGIVAEWFKGQYLKVLREDYGRDV